MSTANQIFEDRIDVPDLLKSLADYPFSFPSFEDTGKDIFLCFQAEDEAWSLSKLCTYYILYAVVVKLVSTSGKSNFTRLLLSNFMQL